MIYFASFAPLGIMLNANNGCCTFHFIISSIKNFCIKVEYIALETVNLFSKMSYFFASQPKSDTENEQSCYHHLQNIEAKGLSKSRIASIVSFLKGLD